MRWRRVATWPILAASGTLGPKLREGDRQVPEGLYPIESLNPMSRFHVALRVGYPNDFDRARATDDGRAELGGDIMVHGSNLSIGCLAMGDEVAEDLFVVTALASVENTSILIAPCDLRVRTDVATPSGCPVWTRALWDEIRSRLAMLPAD
jgi:murein L,D-transpeptidase YafK